MYLEIIISGITAAALCVTAGSAWVGVRRWKHQIRYKVAEKISKCSSELIAQISFVRSRFHQVPIDKAKEPEWQLNWERLQSGVKTLERVRKSYFLAEFHISEETAKGLMELIGVYNHLIDINNNLALLDGKGPECLDLRKEFLETPDEKSKSPLDLRIEKAQSKIKNGIKKYS